MISLWTSALMGAVLLSVDPCGTDIAPNGAERDNAGVVADYVDAYNARDLEAMSGLMHPDIQWLSVAGTSIEIVADGKSDLSAQMRAYMDSSAATTSEIVDEIDDGCFIAVREIARWSASDGSERSQSALAVYELEDGTVRRVWYYPSSR
jgi:hypothetical protein